MLSFRFVWILAALAVGSLLSAVPTVVHADMIPSAPVSANSDAQPLVDAPDASLALIAARLETAGLSAEEIAQRMEQLTPADVATFSQSPEHVQFAAGSWVIWPILLVIAIAAVCILYLFATNDV